MIPSKIFFTTGKGIHKEKLASFESALRRAKIEKYNLVFVSSIFPPNCEVITVEEGSKSLSPGEIVYAVISTNATNEPNRLIASAIGVAQTNRESYGYLSEHHSFGETDIIAGEYAEDLAATMLATTIGIEFDPEKNYNERKEIYQASGYEFDTEHYAISAIGNKEKKWTTVISAAIFIE
ncbi:MAG: Pyruvoyl-dependent arginine decarboxylase [Candidatus Heimdallarchaeota archaeon LC_3]|nr:MAG: Pyruvoyl-dependent arginine decarboxylase [Candidatus Heimdallarchaeota archaeon LC_3]